MGAAKSTLVNESRHELAVAVFGAADAACEFARGRLSLQPGERAALPTPKKGLRLVVSAAGGRTQTLLVKPKDVVPFRKFVRSSQADMQPDAQPEQALVPAVGQEVDARRPAEPQPARGGSRNWLDEKERYNRDELEQLMVRLRREQAARERAPARAGAQAQGQAQPAGVDELTARFAALQGRSAPAGQAPPEQQPDCGAAINTDADTDELMAAIQRLAQPRFSGHARKPSWDRASQPRMVAQR